MGKTEPHVTVVPSLRLLVQARREAALVRAFAELETFRYSEDWDLLLRAARWATPRRIPGVTVEVRLRGSDNASADSGPERRACLDRLAARHGLPPLAIKTFWEVAGAVAMEGP